ncbi:MAG: nitroreductase [Bacteroidales bacterium]|nr:nitroreductase [Bacteroidales bacterium]
MQLLIDTQLCSKCNTCATVCLMKIIERATDTTVPHIPVEKADFCLQCGHCESFCPEQALTLDYLTEEKAEHRLPAATADPNDLAAFMTMRRSIRHFKSKQVPKELILKSLEVARYAPSGGNGQPVNWQVVYDPADVQQIASLTIDWMRSLVGTEHPLAGYVPVVLGLWYAGDEYICHKAPHLLIAHLPADDPSNDNTDAIIALTYVDLAAPLFGIGTCWAGFVTLAAAEYQPLKDFLALPEGRRFAVALLLGYSAYPITAIPRRNPLVVSWKQAYGGVLKTNKNKNNEIK